MEPRSRVDAVEVDGAVAGEEDAVEGDGAEDLLEMETGRRTDADAANGERLAGNGDSSWNRRDRMGRKTGTNMLGQGGKFKLGFSAKTLNFDQNPNRLYSFTCLWLYSVKAICSKYEQDEDGTANNCCFSMNKCIVYEMDGFVSGDRSSWRSLEMQGTNLSAVLGGIGVLARDDANIVMLFYRRRGRCMLAVTEEAGRTQNGSDFVEGGQSTAPSQKQCEFLGERKEPLDLGGPLGADAKVAGQVHSCSRIRKRRPHTSNLRRHHKLRAAANPINWARQQSDNLCRRENNGRKRTTTTGEQTTEGSNRRLLFNLAGRQGAHNNQRKRPQKTATGETSLLQSMIQMGVLVPTGDMTAVRRTALFFLNSFEERLAAQRREREMAIAELGFKKRLSKEEKLRKKKQRLAAIGEDLLSIAADQPFRFPATFTFVVRAFSVLDGIGKGLDPRFDITEIAKPYAMELLRFREFGFEDLRKRWERQSSAFYNLFRQADRVEKLAEIIQRLEQGDLKLRVRTLESERAFQRVAAVQNTIGNAVAGGSLINLATILYFNSVHVPAVTAYILCAFFGVQVLVVLHVAFCPRFATKTMLIVINQKTATAFVDVKFNDGKVAGLLSTIQEQ
ncbi:hypothetical protein KSP40_PGU011242 [Platanthera guangdongensis]|uniref:Uncharacterized protein n=1 Tax=Platanthera guangdongensis TaxID=2320717 RepID=A0ABR2LQ87_9ASPA